MICGGCGRSQYIANAPARHSAIRKTNLAQILELISSVLHGLLNLDPVKLFGCAWRRRRDIYLNAGNTGSQVK